MEPAVAGGYRTWRYESQGTVTGVPACRKRNGTRAACSVPFIVHGTADGAPRKARTVIRERKRASLVVKTSRADGSWIRSFMTCGYLASIVLLPGHAEHDHGSVVEVESRFPNARARPRAVWQSAAHRVG